MSDYTKAAAGTAAALLAAAGVATLAVDECVLARVVVPGDGTTATHEEWHKVCGGFEPAVPLKTGSRIIGAPTTSWTLGFGEKTSDVQIPDPSALPKDLSDRLACACSPRDADCEQMDRAGKWVAAPTGTTLESGTWRGAGCVRRVCEIDLGVSQGYGPPGTDYGMPKECR